MINRKLLLAIAGGAILIAIVSLAVVFWPNQNQDRNGTSYTDPISSEIYTAFPERGDKAESEEMPAPLPNEISITGLEDFFSSIEQDYADSVLTQLTTFVRARTGMQPTIAGVVNADVKQTAENPSKYEFTLALLYPNARYKVTVEMPTAATTPTVTFAELSL